MEKSVILSVLSTFARQRPGLDFRDYGDRRAYFAEVRSITKDLHHFRDLLAAVENRGISASDIIDASKSAFSGRLSIMVDGEKVRIDYTVGQYFPTEYRKAACAILASCLWKYWRECGYDAKGIRQQAKNHFSRSLVSKYFN